MLSPKDLSKRILEFQKVKSSELHRQVSLSEAVALFFSQPIHNTVQQVKKVRKISWLLRIK